MIKLFRFALIVVVLLSHNVIIGQTSIDSSKVVRVLTYNIYHGETVNTPKKFDLDLLAKIIADTNPDLVALQEVDFKTNRAKKLDLMTELGQRTKLVPLFGRAMDFDGGQYGEGVLSRYTFSKALNHNLRAREGKEPRAALEVKVVLKSGDTIRFVGTHLDHTKDETDRVNQVEQLNDLFANDDVPTILAGDLNATPNSNAINVLLNEWHLSFENNEFTYPADIPRLKIDYILFRPANRWRVIETRVLDEKNASDHRPVLSVLELLNP